jgi:hypothetical protein
LGFDPRLCYGDVSLSFVYRPDKEDEPPSPDLDSDIVDGIPYPLSPSPHPSSVHPLSPLIEMARPAVDIVVNDSMPMHNFVLTQFINVRLCDFCRKKVPIFILFRERERSNNFYFKMSIVFIYRFG